MKCAGCLVMFPGIMGLMPYKVASLVTGMKSYDMLCKVCAQERNETEQRYKDRSRGA